MHIIPIGTNKNKERYPKKDIKWLMSSLEYVSMEVFIFFVFNPWENSNCDFFNLAVVFCFLFFFVLAILTFPSQFYVYIFTIFCKKEKKEKKKI